MKSRILFFVFFAAVFLSACSSGDTGGSKAATDDGMQVGVSVPSSAATRVTETPNSTYGLVTAWESTDKLNIFHLYNKTGATASMQGLEFKNSSSAGSSGTFVYSGIEQGYSFNPSNNLYAFSQLPTTSNFTQAYNTGSSNFTLSLSDFSAQDGTVSNLKNYDALYGVSSVDATGTPAGTTMQHLSSVVRFDLTNADFTSTLTSVNFTCGSADTSILPSSGSFALSNTGTVTNGTLTGATSWTVSSVAASSGTASVYLMTFPFQSVTGTLNIGATASDGTPYTRIISLSNLSLTAGQVKAYTVTLNKIPTPDPTPYTGKYYMWDATAEYVSGTNNYNTITTGVATNCCKNCPTLLQIQMYLGAGVMWDTSKLGLWFMKPSYITGFAGGTAPTVAVGASVTPTQVSNYTNPDGQYFFLPAAGYKVGSSVNYSGTVGFYWSSTPYSSGDDAYNLYFDSSGADVDSNGRSDGFCLW